METKSRSWLLRRFGRKHHIIRRKGSLTSLQRSSSYCGNYTLERTLRLGGVSSITIPPPFDESPLAVPACLAATAAYIINDGGQTGGIFRIPGKMKTVTRVYQHFAASLSCIEEPEDTVSLPRAKAVMPSGIDFTISDVASVMKKFLGHLHGGILGSISTFTTMKEIINSAHHLNQSSDGRSETARRLASVLIVDCTPARLSLVTCVFGLLAYIRQEPEASDGSGESAKTSRGHEAMSARSLSLVFAPLLLADLTDEIPCEGSERRHVPWHSRAFPSLDHLQEMFAQCEHLSHSMAKTDLAASVAYYLIDQWALILPLLSDSLARAYSLTCRAADVPGLEPASGQSSAKGGPAADGQQTRPQSNNSRERKGKFRAIRSASIALLSSELRPFQRLKSQRSFSARGSDVRESFIDVDVSNTQGDMSSIHGDMSNIHGDISKTGIDVPVGEESSVTMDGVGEYQGRATAGAGEDDSETEEEEREDVPYLPLSVEGLAPLEGGMIAEEVMAAAAAAAAAAHEGPSEEACSAEPGDVVVENSSKERLSRQASGDGGGNDARSLSRTSTIVPTNSNSSKSGADDGQPRQYEQQPLAPGPDSGLKPGPDRGQVQVTRIVSGGRSATAVHSDQRSGVATKGPKGMRTSTSTSTRQGAGPLTPGRRRAQAYLGDVASGRFVDDGRYGFSDREAANVSRAAAESMSPASQLGPYPMVPGSRAGEHRRRSGSAVPVPTRLLASKDGPASSSSPSPLARNGYGRQAVKSDSLTWADGGGHRSRADSMAALQAELARMKRELAGQRQRVRQAEGRLKDYDIVE